MLADFNFLFANSGGAYEQAAREERAFLARAVDDHGHVDRQPGIVAPEPVQHAAEATTDHMRVDHLVPIQRVLGPLDQDDLDALSTGDGRCMNAAVIEASAIQAIVCHAVSIQS